MHALQKFSHQSVLKRFGMNSVKRKRQFTIRSMFKSGQTFSTAFSAKEALTAMKL